MNTYFTAFFTTATVAPEPFTLRGEEIADLPLDFGSSKSGQCVVA
jgi:hypothetical protein